MSSSCDDYRNRAEASPCDGLPLLLLSSCPLLFWLFLGSAATALAALFYFGLLFGALALIRSGREAELRYHAARAAHRPRLPRKLMGSAIIGFTAFLLAANQATNWILPLFTGLAATGLSLTAFGLDPMRDKGLDDPRIAAEYAAQATLARVDGEIGALVERVARLGEEDLTLRTETAGSAILRLVRAHITDPDEFAAFERPLDTALNIAIAEVETLEAHWATDSHNAARRYTKRIGALADGFEARARKRRSARQGDAFSLDTDLLFDRMNQNRAA